MGYLREDGVEIVAMDREIMDETAQNFAACAQFMKWAGFDGVQIHCGHGWLLHQFLSPRTNRRSDAYGGSRANRERFPLQVLKTVRDAVGSDFLIEIRVSGEETRGLITLRFENSGPTIPREKLDRIFEQFFRLDSSRSSASGGAGLGLAIAKEIVRLHGGSICAASEDNRIVFTVTLPRSQTPPPPSP